MRLLRYVLLIFFLAVTEAWALPNWWVAEPEDPWPANWHTTWLCDEWVNGFDEGDWYVAVNAPLGHGQPWYPLLGAELAATLDWTDPLFNPPLIAEFRWRNSANQWCYAPLGLDADGDWLGVVPTADICGLPWFRALVWLEDSATHTLWYEAQMVPEPAWLGSLLIAFAGWRKRRRR